MGFMILRRQDPHSCLDSQNEEEQKRKSNLLPNKRSSASLPTSNSYQTFDVARLV